MAESSHFDLIVIGGGPGGYVGAIRAGQLGMKVACIERDRLGGVCLNWGCIPSKALLHNAELYMEAVRHADEWGFSFKEAKFDFSKIIGRSRGITDKITGGVGFLFKKNKVTHVQGHAKIASGKSAHEPCRVEVREPEDNYYNGSGKGQPKQTLTADRVLIATGAKPNELPFAPFDGETVISSYTALSLKKRPEKMVVIGSGAIGMEFAYFYNAFGTKVTVVEMLERVVPVEDAEISKLVQRTFEKQGMTFHVGHIAKAVDKKKGGGVTVTIADVKDEKKTQKIDCDVVLVAIGVGARMDGLFDDKLGIELVKKHIKTDYRGVDEPTYRTSVPGIYAIGDVIGPPWLAHKAMEEAVVAVERVAGHHTLGIDYKAIPGCTYCNPQIASIGLTEQAAKDQGIECNIGRYKLASHGKAIAIGATDGMVKLITSKPYNEILGCHIFGEDASELIAEIAVAMRLEATAEDIISTVHAHPTMHEAVHEAALGTEGRMLHQ